MKETKAPSPLCSAGALQNQVIIIGAGHNGLVAAFYLARAGLKPLVLERRAIVGGACVTEEFHPGFRASLANSAGPLLPQVISDLQLRRHGLELIDSPVRVAALNLDGPPLCIYEDAKRTAGELAAHSRKDSEKYSEFASCFANIGRTLRSLLTM